MSKCYYCRIETPADEMIASGQVHPKWMHRSCYNSKDNWFYRVYFRFMAWLDGFEPCPKEQKGYTCRHQIRSNGTMECGYDE